MTPPRDADSVMVPRQPTEAMLDAAYSHITLNFRDVIGAWAAMLAAAPSPDAPVAGAVQVVNERLSMEHLQVLSDLEARLSSGDFYGDHDADWARVGDLRRVISNTRLAPPAAKPSPKHQWWGAGEPDCPKEIKAGNGELHTLRCKVCGTSDPDASCKPSPDAQGGDSREGMVLVPRSDLLALLDGNLEAANIALGIHSNIDFIEAHGGADSDDDTEQMTYHLFYSLHPANRLRALAEASPAPAAVQGEDALLDEARNAYDKDWMPGGFDSAEQRDWFITGYLAAHRK